MPKTLAGRLLLVLCAAAVPLFAFNMAIITAMMSLRNQLSAIPPAVMAERPFLADMGDTLRWGLWMAWLCCGLCVILAPALFSILARRMLRPLIDITRALRRISQGDIDTEIPHLGDRGEIGAMAADVMRFVETAAIAQDARSWQLQGVKDFMMRREMALMNDALDGEATQAVGPAIESMGKVCEASMANVQRASAMKGSAEAITVRTEEMARSIDAVAAATEELSAASGEISRQVAGASRCATEATGRAVAATSELARLRSATDEVAGITDLIRIVADQTNLLALNATIEAARAGEAGKGFAVVAAEVKILSRRSAEAVEQIAARTSAIVNIGQTVATSVESIASEIKSVETMAVAVAAAVEEQDATIREIGRNAAGVASAARNTANEVRTIAVAADEVTVAANGTSSSIESASALIENLRARLIAVMKQASGANTSRQGAIPFPVESKVVWDGHDAVLPVHNLTDEDGEIDLVWFSAAFPGTPKEKDVLTIHIPLAGDIDASMFRVSDAALHFAFQPKSGEQRAVLQSVMSRYVMADSPYIEAASTAATTIAGLFEAAVDAREISLDDLFDTAYQPIAGSNPQQFTTKFLPLADRLLRPLLEPVLAALPGITFCVALDRNGYVPTHNAKFSQPQGNDPVWNNANCRNRRIFNDRVGLAAGRNQEPYLMQAYLRDMGGGNFVLMSDVSVPITVKGRHWGGFRLGYRMPDNLDRWSKRS